MSIFDAKELIILKVDASTNFLMFMPSFNGSIVINCSDMPNLLRLETQIK